MVEAASVLNLKAKTTKKVRIDSPISRETLKLAIATSNAGKLIIYLSFIFTLIMKLIKEIHNYQNILLFFKKGQLALILNL